jgi:Tfp pilus assembly protein PilV
MKRLKSENGFILIEIICAVAILSITVLPIAGLFLQSTKSNIHSREITVSTLLAQDKIEELKSLPFNELAKKQGEFRDTLTVDDIIFHRTTKIYMKKPNLIKITVQVKGKGREVTLVTQKGFY